MMAQPPIDLQWIAIYDDVFCNDVHQLLAWGYCDARHKIDYMTLEEEISGYIYEAVKTRLNDSDTPGQFDRYSIHNESPVTGSLNAGKKRQRLDIVMESTQIKPRPEFMFEAKRLAKNKNPIGDYLGAEGLQCYTNEEYAQEYSSAGMIGYMQSDDETYWSSEILRKFQEVGGTNKYNVENDLSKVTVNVELPNEWVSTHSRSSSRNIKIYHILLDCC